MNSDRMIFQQHEETIEELAATVAHEIKNPVSLALANLYMIKTEDKNRQFTHYCNVIEKELYKISGLAAEFTDLSHTRPDNKRIDVNKLMANVVADFQNAGITRIFFTPAAPVMVCCDPKKISIVFTNLIKNALEATGQDGIVEISVTKDGENAAISVKDNGCGFSQAALSLTPGYSSKRGGSGLGLRICRNTIERHDGTLMVQNNAKQGATVLVTLPLDRL